MEDLYALRPAGIWRQFKKEGFAFWMICGYLVVEYVRPQSIHPQIDILPWAKTFLVLALVGWLAEPRKKWVSDPTNFWMAAFLGVITLSCFTAYWPAVSWSNYHQFFNWFVIYFLIINVVNTRQRFFIFLLIFLLASFKLSFFGARTWAMSGFAFRSWGIKGPSGFFENPGELAIQMLVFAPIAYWFAMALRPWIGKWKFRILCLFPLTAAMTTLGTNTRGSQLALAFQLWLNFLKGRFSLRVMLIVVALGVGGYHLLPEQQLERFRVTGSEEDTTGQQRILYFKNGIEMIKEHPFLGVGYFNFIPYFTLHYPEDLVTGKTIYTGRAELPHNIFIQVGTDAGLIGLIVYAMLILRAFAGTRALRRMAVGDGPNFAFERDLSKGFDVAFWGFLIAGQFVTVGYYPFMWIHLALVVALKNSVLQRERIWTHAPTVSWRSS